MAPEGDENPTFDREPLTYTVTEAARLLGLSKNSAYAAVHSGELPVVRIGRRMLVPKIAIERLLGLTS